LEELAKLRGLTEDNQEGLPDTHRHLIGNSGSGRAELTRDPTFSPPIGSAAELYAWMVETVRGRSHLNSLPNGMPPMFEEIEVHTQRKGDGEYIKFTHESNFTASLEDQANKGKLEYGTGYALVGNSDR
jgi:hypothetical protein